MTTYRNFLQLALHTYSPESYAQILSALRLSHRELADMKRYTGEPLLMHSVGVAYIVVSEIGLGRNSTIAALLHDVFRLGKITPAEILSQFGEKCLEIVRGLNNISQVDPKTSTLQSENFKELIVSYSTDPRVILIKMADRLEVMRALDSFPEPKRIKKSWETLHLYSQIAHKLGLYAIKSEMEDISLRHLEPKDYKHIQTKLAESEAERLKFIAAFVEPIKAKLDTLGVTYKLKSRTKSIYSIWRKMHKQKVTFEGVYDIFAIRIVIDCPVEREKMNCWTAFSVVTDFYTPNPDRMRDWISIPKSNGYESLHTTVVTPQGKWVEVQIRTERMDEVAERGVAAHWRYKGVEGGGLNSAQWLERLRGIVENSGELSEEFDLTLGSSEVFVFTPTGDLRKLPEGATLLDFAFDIHSSVGASCTGGKVNGRNVPIREVLRSGDIAEVVTGKNQRAKADWLNFVVTSKAKSKIKQILREDLASSASLGREELQRKARNWKINMSLEECVTLLVKHYKVKTGIEVYNMIAQQRVPMAEIKEVLQNGRQLISGEVKPRKITVSKTTSDNQDALIIDENLRNVEYKLAKCCNPIYGDPIFGFVTIHSGITIHREDCPNASRLTEQYPYRMMPARWHANGASGTFRAQIHITGDDRQGMAGEITELVSRTLNINIRTLNLSSFGGSMQGILAIEVGSSTMVDMVVANIKKIKGITKIYRIN